MTALLCLASDQLTNKHKQVESTLFSSDKPNKMSTGISGKSSHKVTTFLTKEMCFRLPFLLCFSLCSEFYLRDNNEPISIS
jgi:hypothetical protein